MKIKIIIILSFALGCSYDDTNHTRQIAQQVQLNYGNTKNINIGNDQNPVNLNISFVKVRDNRCNCMLCYPGGVVYVHAYFLVGKKGNQHTDTLMLKRQQCIDGNLEIGDPSMDVESVEGLRFGLKYITATDSVTSLKNYKTIITTVP